MTARQAVQTAEDARAIAVKRQTTTSAAERQAEPTGNCAPRAAAPPPSWRRSVSHEQPSARVTAWARIA